MEKHTLWELTEWLNSLFLSNKSLNSQVWFVFDIREPIAFSISDVKANGEFLKYEYGHYVLSLNNLHFAWFLTQRYHTASKDLKCMSHMDHFYEAFMVFLGELYF